VRAREGEAGYALVAAVASVALFALMALAALHATRASVITASAEIDRAKLLAAADAGIALALDGLLAEDRTSRWSIDGRTRRVGFDGMTLQIVVQDERGKIPLNLMDEGQVRDMFERLGLTGERLDIVTDSFLDWRDEDEERRPNGAEAEDYAAAGIRPRNGALRSLGELAMIRGLDASLAKRLAPVATVHFGDGSFEPRFAQPFALEVMGGGDGPAAIERARELAGQRPAIELGDDVPLTGRPLNILVDSVGPAGAHAHRSAIVELSGSALRPYVVLDYE
jgi:hypothetical protein